MPKKIPMRQCLGCREMKPKPELIRVVRSPEGGLSLDFRGKKPGRGAYRPRMPCQGEKEPRHRAGPVRPGGAGGLGSAGGADEGG